MITKNLLSSQSMLLNPVQVMKKMLVEASEGMQSILDLTVCTPLSNLRYISFLNSLGFHGIEAFRAMTFSV